MANEEEQTCVSAHHKGAHAGAPLLEQLKFEVAFAASSANHNPFALILSKG